MNAKEVLGMLEPNWIVRSEYRDTVLRALRLLAAAEANDGSTPETNDLAALLTNRTMDEGIILDRMRDIERERNALSARVAELENECSAADIYGRTSASHGFINAPKWHELADETKSLYRESAARSKP